MLSCFLSRPTWSFDNNRPGKEGGITVYHVTPFSYWQFLESNWAVRLYQPTLENWRNECPRSWKWDPGDTPLHPLCHTEVTTIHMTWFLGDDVNPAVVQLPSYLTLCDPLDCSMPGFSVLYRFLEFAQTHVHCVNDAIQPSHLLSPPSPSALSFSQHQGLSQWVSNLHQVAKVLALQFQYQSFQWIFRADFL